MGSEEYDYRRRIRLFTLEEGALYFSLSCADCGEMIQRIETSLPAWLLPNWQHMRPTPQPYPIDPSIFTFRLQQPTVLHYAGAERRQGSWPGDVLAAIYALPEMQRLVLQVRDHFSGQLRRLEDELLRGSPAALVSTITATALFVGICGAFIGLNWDHLRQIPINLSSPDIGVPGVNGLSFRIRFPRLQIPSTGPVEFDVTVNFNVLEFLRSQGFSASPSVPTEVDP